MHREKIVAQLSSRCGLRSRILGRVREHGLRPILSATPTGALLEQPANGSELLELQLSIVVRLVGRESRDWAVLVLVRSDNLIHKISSLV